MFCMFVPWHVFDYSCVNLVSWTSMMQFSQFIADWKRLDKGFASNLTLRFPPLVPGKAAKTVIHKEGSSLYMKIWSRSGSLSLEKSIVCSLRSWNGWRWWKQQVRINKSAIGQWKYMFPKCTDPPRKQKQVTAHRALRLALQKILQHNWSFASRSHKWWEIREDASWDLWIFALLLWQRRSSVFHSIT